jgi:predicted nucleotidyltransferase
MKTVIKKIVDDIVVQYKKDKNVLGVLLCGSIVKNKFDRYSDIDIYILLKKKGKYARLNFIKNKIRVDIIVNTTEEARIYLKNDEYNVQRNTSSILAYGKILFQRLKHLENLQYIARKNLKLRTQYSKEEVLMHKYSIDDFWGEIQRDIEKNDVIAFGLDSQFLLNNIIELFLKLHGDFLRQPKEMSEVFRKLDKTFWKKIESFYAVNDLQKKQKKLAELVRYIYKKSNGGLPHQWVVKN